MKPSRAFVRMARRGCCASPMPWMISRRRREGVQVLGSVNTRSWPSATRSCCKLRRPIRDVKDRVSGENHLGPDTADAIEARMPMQAVQGGERHRRGHDVVKVD